MEFGLVEGERVEFVKNIYHKYGIAVRVDEQDNLNLLASYETRRELERSYMGWVFMGNDMGWKEILPFERTSPGRFDVLTDMVEEHEKYFV